MVSSPAKKQEILTSHSNLLRQNCIVSTSNSLPEMPENIHNDHAGKPIVLLCVQAHSRGYLLVRDPVAGVAEKFTAGIIKDRDPAQPAESGMIFHHAIMNLPASAVEFLDAFGGSFSAELWHGRRLPLVHVYTFARSCETDEGKCNQTHSSAVFCNH